MESPSLGFPNLVSDCIGHADCFWRYGALSFNRTCDSPRVVKLRDVYTDWRIVTGLALVLLGAGNWLVGMQRTQIYSRIIAETAKHSTDNTYLSFDELDPGSSGAVLEPLTTEQRRVSYATARMDFYHATFLTGQALVIVGLILTLIGFISLIQRDALVALRRFGPKSDDPTGDQ